MPMRNAAMQQCSNASWPVLGPVHFRIRAIRAFVHPCIPETDGLDAVN